MPFTPTLSGFNVVSECNIYSYRGQVIDMSSETETEIFSWFCLPPCLLPSHATFATQLPLSKLDEHHKRGLYTDTGQAMLCLFAFQLRDQPITGDQ